MKKHQEKFLARFGSKEHADELLGLNYWKISAQVAKNPSLTVDQLDVLAKHKYVAVRRSASKNPNATEEQKALIKRTSIDPRDPSNYYCES